MLEIAIRLVVFFVFLAFRIAHQISVDELFVEIGFPYGSRVPYPLKLIVDQLIKMRSKISG